MPLWLQGVVEFGQAAVLSALLVFLPLIGVWFADGFTDRDFASLARLGGQGWLLIHGVPLTLTFPAGTLASGATSGLLPGVPTKSPMPRPAGNRCVELFAKSAAQGF